MRKPVFADSFISIASHELRTPITSIKGYMYLLKKECKPEGKQFKYAVKIERQLDKLNELVQDLLDINRIKGGKLMYRVDKFSMASLIRNVVRDLQEITPNRKIILKNGIKKMIRGDSGRISQVLINLITNAIKYSPSDKKVLVNAEEENGNAHISVRDYGMGIGKSEKDKIFERFYRAKNARGETFPGLGIGLYLSREIVERHNGKIWVESRKGKGSTFHFTLPLTN
jgi:signal transduction histidine kinase